MSRIAPHVNRERDHGYPFGSEPELCTAAHHGNLDLLYCLETLERQAVHMDQTYGEALRYVMYRDLNRRLSMYARLAERT